jgi:hypothetical protein
MKDTLKIIRMLQLYSLSRRAARVTGRKGKSAWEGKEAKLGNPSPASHVEVSMSLLLVAQAAAYLQATL